MADHLESSLGRIPRNAQDDFTPEVIAERRALAESVSGRALPLLFGTPAEPREARSNIENFVGYAQVPVGLAGPLLVDTSQGPREVLVPMATNEGAMVASYSRGMALLRKAGGARARVTQEGLSQHPILVYGSAREAAAAVARVPDLAEPMRAIVASITRHGALRDVSARTVGRRLILELVFTTGDAIGINMASQGADLVATELARETGALARYVHGQDVEKRANARALVHGRGRSTYAEVVLPAAIVRDSLRAEPTELVDIWRTYAVGFADLGTQNWTVQAANGLSAVYLACGQDVAYITESATGQLDFHVTETGDLHASVSLPSLLVGTVGGGSNKGTAAECLDIMGVRGSGHANVFAELLAATVLAGDLSLLGAFCSHEFVAAHQRLGRNRPQEGRGS